MLGWDRFDLKAYDNVPLAGAIAPDGLAFPLPIPWRRMEMKWSIAALALAGLVAVSILAQDRVNIGKVSVADERQTLDRGRLGSQESMPYGPLTLNGILVDANCTDRSEANLTRPPIPINQVGPAETPELATAENAKRAKMGYATATHEPDMGGISAHGITVDPQTLQEEQADALQHQVPDMTTRQEDLTCSITARTSNFALLMDNGRLLNLDGGGAAWAWQAVQSSDAGRAMMEGQGPAVKPHATITGVIDGDQVKVNRLQLP
jgi:hypothetical protein